MKQLVMAAVCMATMGGMTTHAAGNKGETTRANPFFTEYTTPFGVPPFEQIRIDDYMPPFLKGM